MTIAEEHIAKAERFAESAALGKGSMYGQTHATIALAHATIALALAAVEREGGVT